MTRKVIACINPDRVLLRNRGVCQILSYRFLHKKKTKLIDSGRSDPPYNKNSYPAYDKDNQYVGIHTPLDKLYSSKNQISPNPMDDNWGGHQYTKSMLDSGYFKDDEVWEWH